MLAQGSVLRVLCAESDKGAEISVNGTVKGACPRDIQVEAGTVKLRVVSRKSANAPERVYEQTIRMGDGTLKTVEAVLAAPRSTKP